MKIKPSTYQRIARVYGALFTLMGVGLGALFIQFLVTGAPIASGPVTVDGIGVLLMATIGAFTLPLGLSLLSKDKATSSRMEVGGTALGLMALIRLAAYLDAELGALVGVTALVEFFVLGTLGFVAYFVRPSDESAIELGLDIDLDVPVSTAWQVLGEEFGDVGEYVSGIDTSTAYGGLQVGGGRTCSISGFGPFSASEINEELTLFDRDAMKFAYVANKGLPPMFEEARNRFSIEATGTNQCRVTSRATIELRWWALPLAGLLGWSIRSNLATFAGDLRQRVAQGDATPQNQAA